MEKYLGIPYSEANCLEFVVHVLADHFGKRLVLPVASTHEEITDAMFEARHEFANEIAGELADGDVVLFRPGAEIMHVGVIFKEAYEPYVLHSRRATGSLYEPLRIVARQMKVAGFYRVP